jgi:hypothetical protein
MLSTMNIVRWLTALTVPIALAAAAVAPAGRAQAASERLLGVCEHRACLLVLAAAADTDGDGVTDVDEAALRTDPRNARSHPVASDVIDRLIERRLPSFEGHLTEAVVLPALTPDGHAFATGLGRFALPTRPGATSLADTVRDLLNGLTRNGFGFGLGLEVRGKPPVAGLLPDTMGSQVALGGAGYTGPPSYGPNAGKRVDTVTSGTAGANGTRTPEYSQDRDGSLIHSLTIKYSDGSTDAVTSVGTSDSTSFNTSSTVVSTDTSGSETITTITTTVQTNDNGSVSAAVKVESTTKDANGNVTGSSSTSASITTGNGTTTTAVESTTTDASGNTTGGGTIETDRDDSSDCSATPCTVGEYVDPDYVQFVASDEDAARALSRLDQTRRPGPDTGDVDLSAPATHFPHLNPLIALLNTDGVTVLAAGYHPDMNHAQPDYDPRLTALSEMSGERIPKPNVS